MYISRTWSVKEGAILGGLAIILHMLSILYLRMEYHKVYEGYCEIRTLLLFIPIKKIEL